MSTQAVSLKVVAPIPIECSFWIGDDGWSGVCQPLGVAIRAANFEEAKKKMEVALRETIERLLRDETSRNEKAARKIA
jgi:hypothetical protein